MKEDSRVNVQHQHQTRTSKKVVCGANTRIGASFGDARSPFGTTWHPMARKNNLPINAINRSPILLRRPGGLGVFVFTFSAKMLNKVNRIHSSVPFYMVKNAEN